MNKLLIMFLYLTPVGYVLILLGLLSGSKTPGVYVDLPRNKPVRVYVNENPNTRDRVQWLFNGTVLLMQAVIIIHKNLGGDFGMTYSWIALIFGIVNVVSALVPRFNWNGNLIKSVNLSVIWVVLIIYLLLAVVYVDVFGFFAKSLF